MSAARNCAASSSSPTAAASAGSGSSTRSPCCCSPPSWCWWWSSRSEPGRSTPVAHQRSSAVPLAWLYAGLIAYASLYPFGAWRLPGHEPLDFLLLPWPRYWTGFDLVANLLGYLPLGALVFGAG